MRKLMAGAAFLMAAALLFGSLPQTGQALAAEGMAVSEKEYSLTVEDVPVGVEGRVYAKLHDASLDAKEYVLSLFDGYDALVKMEDALEAAGEDLAKLDYLAMDITLYQRDEEGDYYPLEELGGITIICPVPEEYIEEAGDLQVTAVNASGKLERIPASLVLVEKTTCVKFDLSKAKIYAFLVKQGGRLVSGTIPTATPIPEKTPTRTPEKTPTPEPTKAPEKTPTPEPTRAPKKTPTPVPTDAPQEKAPAKSPAASSSQASATVPAQQQVQGTAAGNSSANSGKAVAKGGSVAAANPTTAPSQPVRDRTPQTGDDFSQGEYLALLGAGMAAFGGLLFLYQKKK